MTQDRTTLRTTCEETEEGNAGGIREGQQGGTGSNCKARTMSHNSITLVLPVNLTKARKGHGQQGKTPEGRGNGWRARVQHTPPHTNAETHTAGSTCTEQKNGKKVQEGAGADPARREKPETGPKGTKP